VAIEKSHSKTHEVSEKGTCQAAKKKLEVAGEAADSKIEAKEAVEDVSPAEQK